VSLLEILNIQPGISVEGLEALMSQELFNVVEIGVAFDEFTGAAPPESVRRDGVVQIHRTSNLPDSGPELMAGQGISVFRQEHGVA